MRLKSSTEHPRRAAQSMPEALEASSLHGFHCDRQLRLELYSATFALAEHKPNGILQLPPEKEARIAVSSIVSTENVIEGNLSCLMCLFGRNPRPSPQCLCLLPLLGKLHPTMHHSLPARSGERHHLAKSSTNFRLGTVSRINSQRTERAVAWTRALTFWKPKPAQRSPAM